MNTTQPPPQIPNVTPYLLVPGVERLLQFLATAFGAETVLKLNRPDGSVMHAEVRIGSSRIMLGEPLAAPMPATLYLEVPDCDTLYQRAIAAGGVSVMEPADMSHAGARYGGVKDPSGNVWYVATQIENVPVDEQARRIERDKHKWATGGAYASDPAAS